MSQSAEERIADLELAVSVLCQVIAANLGPHVPRIDPEEARGVLDVLEQIRRRQLDRGRLEAIAEKLGDDILYVGP